MGRLRFDWPMRWPLRGPFAPSLLLEGGNRSGRQSSPPPPPSAQRARTGKGSVSVSRASESQRSLAVGRTGLPVGRLRDWNRNRNRRPGGPDSNLANSLDLCLQCAVRLCSDPSLTWRPSLSNDVGQLQPPGARNLPAPPCSMRVAWNLELGRRSAEPMKQPRS
jgi:hypothetical protein